MSTSKTGRERKIPANLRPTKICNVTKDDVAITQITD
jgi:hypothetical protein